MENKKPSEVPPSPPDLPSAISGYEKESAEASAKLRDIATTEPDELQPPKKK
jgi:hypothetical protein